jgi:hypothetical protein
MLRPRAPHAKCCGRMRERDRDQLLCATAAQGAGAGAQRRPRRDHVVHQHDARRGTVDQSHRRWIGESRGARAPHLPAPARAPQAGVEGELADPREGEGDLLRGVVAAPAKSPRRRRHRHDPAGEQARGCRGRDRLGGAAGERQPTTKLERRNQLARRARVRGRAPRGVEGGGTKPNRSCQPDLPLAALAQGRLPRAPLGAHAATRRGEKAGEERRGTGDRSMASHPGRLARQASRGAHAPCAISPGTAPDRYSKIARSTAAGSASQPITDGALPRAVSGSFSP